MTNSICHISDTRYTRRERETRHQYANAQRACDMPMNYVCVYACTTYHENGERNAEISNESE